MWKLAVVTAKRWGYHIFLTHGNSVWPCQNSSTECFFLCFFFVDRYGYQQMVEISLRKSTDLSRSPEQCVHPSLQPVTNMTLEFGQFWHVTILTIPSCVLAKQVNIEFFEWTEIFYTGPFTYLTGLTESNGRLLGLWLRSPVGWLLRTGISSGTLRSFRAWDYLYLYLPYWSVLDVFFL